METQVVIPKWQAKFEKSFPSEIMSVVSEVPKAEATQNSSNKEGINPWLVAGLLAFAGIACYIIWKGKQEAKKREQTSQPQIYNNSQSNYNPNFQN